MHFCWIAAALLNNIILHLVYGYLGNVISMPLGASDLRLTDSGLSCIRRLWELSRSAAHLGDLLWKVSSLCLMMFPASDLQISQVPDTQLHMCEYILWQSPVQCHNNKLNMFLFLQSVTFFVFSSSNSTRADGNIRSNCDSGFYQWISMHFRICVL